MNSTLSAADLSAIEALVTTLESAWNAADADAVAAPFAVDADFVRIEAPWKSVWDAMLEPDSYRVWTAEFCEGSCYEGSWDVGQRIRFLAPDCSGLSSVIAENWPCEFLSIRHVGSINPKCRARLRPFTGGPAHDVSRRAGE